MRKGRKNNDFFCLFCSKFVLDRIFVGKKDVKNRIMEEKLFPKIMQINNSLC